MGINYLLPPEDKANQYYREVRRLLKGYSITKDVGVKKGATVYFLQDWPGSPVVFVRAHFVDTPWRGRTTVIGPENQFENVQIRLEQLVGIPLTPFTPSRS